MGEWRGVGALLETTLGGTEDEARTVGRGRWCISALAGGESLGEKDMFRSQLLRLESCADGGGGLLVVAGVRLVEDDVFRHSSVVVGTEQDGTNQTNIVPLSCKYQKEFLPSHASASVTSQTHQLFFQSPPKQLSSSPSLPQCTPRRRGHARRWLTPSGGDPTARRFLHTREWRMRMSWQPLSA